ncbi:MAG: glucan biosynthesis protein [Hyphomicrobiaceae bacterium]|nr:glucan biosynthesis protein [Hyphomicrobiaceae bacterium]
MTALTAFGSRRVLAGAGRGAAADASAAGSAATGRTVRYGPVGAFSFDRLKAEAAARAAKPFVSGRSPHGAILDLIDYDAYQKITFRKDASLPLAKTPVQLFHLGKFFQEPVRVHLVENGAAREVIFERSLFDMPDAHPARDLPDNAGFAGFRVMAPDLKTDWLAFLGASYFRTSGPYNQYGLSARGLAIDTGMPTPEEFPRFTDFWLEAGDGQSLTIYAALDSPSVSGAYRMVTRRTTNADNVHLTTQDITLELHARKDIQRLGIAPFSSMFWYGEGNRAQGTDWRPEVHDSDGLAILTGAGERLWRPLNNPPRVMTSSFVDRDVKGFGLLQRDRDFVSYLDDGIFYERRASAWIEPGEGWGPGAVQLLEIPTDDEIHDNIALYWTPEKSMKAGDRSSWSYRLTWCDDVPFPDDLARTIATFAGKGGRPGQKRPEGTRKYVVDFGGPVFDGLGRDDVELVVTASRGTISNDYAHPVVDQRRRWRALFDIKASGPEPVEVRAYLRHGTRALTETWLTQHFPET